MSSPIEYPFSRARSATHTTQTTHSSSLSPSPMTAYSFSRSWKSPAVLARERWTRILKARDHICPDSPFLVRIFDHTEQRRYMGAAKLALAERKTNSTNYDATLRAQHAATTGKKATSLFPFQGHVFPTNHASVLGLPTIWSPRWKLGKPYEAPWPAVAEMKYEGDDRIATGKENRRFLPVPRFPAEPGVELTFDKIDFLPQFELDKVNRIPNVEEVFFLSHDVDEVEVTEQEAALLVGEDLLHMLDPADIYCTGQ